jgi:hypothetical protein
MSLARDSTFERFAGIHCSAYQRSPAFNGRASEFVLSVSELDTDQLHQGTDIEQVEGPVED